MVSVVMNTYNEDPNHLRRAIESYQNQKGIDFELIISTIDDDKNLDIIKRCGAIVVTMPKADHPGKSPKGSYMQINNALPHCKGDYFCFASSNDWADEKKLLTEVSALIANDKQVCYSDYNLVRHDGSLIDIVQFCNYNPSYHLKTNFVSDCAMIKMSLLKKYMPFDLTKGNFAFWYLWLKIYKYEDRHGDISSIFHYNALPTWNYRRSEDSMSQQRRLTLYDRMEYQQAREKFIKDFQIETRHESTNN